MAATPTTHLYRILSFKHVVDLLESKELHFVLPSLWEDPYEKAIEHKLSDALFAQCWCTKATSDAMWRIYSPDRTSVRIKATRKNLENTLSECSQQKSIEYLIKDVEYLSPDDVDTRISGVAKDLKQNLEFKRAADALVIKRDAFDHESEVRIIIYNKKLNNSAKQETSFRLSINPDILIESIHFDPRVDDAFFKMCEYYLKNSLQFKGKIKKSPLYRAFEAR